MVTHYVLSDHAVVSATNIIVGHSSDRSVLSMDPEKNINIPFEGCFIHFYECLFTKINLCCLCLNLRWTC